MFAERVEENSKAWKWHERLGLQGEEHHNVVLCCSGMLPKAKINGGRGLLEI